MRFTFSILYFLMNLSLYAQDRAGVTRIEGKLINANDRFVYGAAVILLDTEGNTITTDSTDQRGEFILKITEQGPYWIDFKSAKLGFSHHFILPEAEAKSRLTAKFLKTSEQGKRAEVSIAFEKRELTEFSRIQKETSDAVSRFYQAILKHSDNGTKNLDGFEPVDYSEKIREIDKRIKAETNTVVKSALYIQYLALEGMKSIIQTSDITRILTIELDLDMVRQAYEMIPPTSPLWAIEPHALEAILRIDPESYPEYKSFFDKMVSSNPYEYVRTNALFKLARFARDQELDDDFANYFGILISNYPESKAAFRAKAMFDIASGLSTGNPAPDYEINSLDNPNEFITNASLEGKVYLLEFWGLGCKGCIMDMPKLHKAYKKFKGQGFEILSVSLDGERFLDATQRFRQDKYPMPWLNGFAKKKFSSQIAKDYEVYAIPSPYLIDEQGKIIARGEDLRGDKLLEILMEYFKERK